MKIFIANDKGGVGKSTLAQYFVYRFIVNRIEFEVVDYDHQPKLARLFGPKLVSANPVGPALSSFLNDAESAEQFWDPLIRKLRVERSLLVDFGAQAFSFFSDWAALTDLKSLHKGEGVVVVVPVTADLEAIIGAQRIVDRAPEILNNVRVVLAMSDKDGAIKALKGIPEFDALLSCIDNVSVCAVRVPNLKSAGYSVAAARGLSLPRLATLDTSGLVSATGLTSALANRTLKDVRTWLDTMTQNLEPVLASGGAVARVEPAAPISQAPARREEPRAVWPKTMRPEDPQTTAYKIAPAVERGQQPEAVEVQASTHMVNPAVMPVELFDEAFYLAEHPDVADAIKGGEFASGYDHYANHGFNEGRLARKVRR
jgi:hypothetical protein